MSFLMPPHPLTNFEMQKYYKNEPRFSGLFPRNNLPKKINDRAYVTNLDEYVDTQTRWSFKKIAKIRIQIKSLNKIKRFKLGCQNILLNYKKWKTQNQKQNQQKLENNLKQHIVSGVQILRRSLDCKK